MHNLSFSPSQKGIKDEGIVHGAEYGLPFFGGGQGLYLSMLRSYSRPCTQESLQVVLGTIVIPEIRSRSATCKALAQGCISCSCNTNHVPVLGLLEHGAGMKGAGEPCQVLPCWGPSLDSGKALTIMRIWDSRERCPLQRPVLCLNPLGEHTENALSPPPCSIQGS